MAEMHEDDDLKNLPAKMAGLNEPERVYHGMQRMAGSGGAPLPGYAPPSGGGDFSLRDLLYVIFRHKWKILLTFLLLSAATVAYVASMPRLYESEARIFVRGDRTGVTVDPTGEGNSFLKGNREGADVRSEMGIITSPALAQKVVEALGPAAVLGAKPERSLEAAATGPLDRWLARADTTLEGVIDRLNLGTPHLTPPQAAAQNIVAGLEAAPTASMSNILTLTYRAGSPENARQVLDALLDAYLDTHIAIHKTQVSPEFFQAKVGALRKQLVEKENTLDAERKRLKISSLEGQKSMLLSQYNTFDTALKENAMRISALRAKIGQLETMGRDATRRGAGQGSRAAAPAAPATNPLLDQLRGRLVELKLRESDLASRYTDKNGELRDVRNQIAELEKMIKAETAKAASGEGGLIAGADPKGSELELQAQLAKVELEAENARESKLIEELAGTRQELATLLGYEKDLKQLEREVELLENEYRQYLKSMQVADISAMLDKDKIGNVSIVQRATLPTEPVKSQRKLLALLGFGIFLSLATGIAWAFGLEYCDHSVKTNEDVERKLGLPVLVAVPHIKNHKPRMQEGLLQ